MNNTEGMRFPNAVIAGAPKCGTTSIFKFLADHPDVCASNVKETYFLMDEGYPLYNPGRNVASHGLEKYSEFFNHCKNSKAKVYLEATPDYLYQTTPLKYLPNLDPVPEIIIVLRKPADRIYSMFQFARNNMAVLDAHITFADFMNSLRNPDSALLANRPHLRDAIAHSRYVRYIEPWIKTFGREHIHVLLFEDLVRDSRDFMQRLCDILQIAPEFYKSYEFKKQNVTQRVRIQFLHRIVRRVRKLSNGGVPGGRFAGAIYRRLNAPPATDARCEEVLRLLETLNNEFIEDNRRLMDLLGLDLKHWHT